jgi:hypothetical protein
MNWHGSVLNRPSDELAYLGRQPSVTAHSLDGVAVSIGNQARSAVDAPPGNTEHFLHRRDVEVVRQTLPCEPTTDIGLVHPDAVGHVLLADLGASYRPLAVQGFDDRVVLVSVAQVIHRRRRSMISAASRSLARRWISSENASAIWFRLRVSADFMSES